MLFDITSYLAAGDISELACTCQRFNKIMNPLIWAHIYLPDWRPDPELQAPPPFKPLSLRRSQIYGGTKYLFRMLCDIKDESRRKELLSQVESLSMVVDEEPGIDAWNLLPHLRNVKALEVRGCYWHDPSKYGWMSEIDDAPIPQLRFAKLFGYIPPTVAKWVIMGCSTTLERLELGMLDAPLSDCSCPEPVPYLAPLFEDDWNGEVPPSPSCDSEYGVFIIPRPLRGFLNENRVDEWGYEIGSEAQIEMKFSRLKHLHLCRPCALLEESYEEYDYTWSSRADHGSLADWRDILQASSETLETLVLEHRPGAIECEQDEYSVSEFMKRDEEGFSSRTLVDMLEAVLFREDAFPALKYVYLAGIPVGFSRENPSKLVPGGQLVRRLEDRGIRCEAELGSWCLFEFEGETEWNRDVGSDDEEEDEDDDEDDYEDDDEGEGDEEEEEEEEEEKEEGVYADENLGEDLMRLFTSL